MPVPELDFAALTAPIPGDEPAGPRVPFTLRQRLEAARKDFEPNPDDPAGAPVAKKPDWSGIVRTALDTLTDTSKDLETALRLTEALTRTDGFVGLREGMKVLTALVRGSWDHLHPMPDPEDGTGPEIRAERFNWLGDVHAGARFPNTVREIPVLRIGNRQLSLVDRDLVAKGQIEGLTSDDLNRVELARETTAQEVDEAVQAFFALDGALTEKLQNQAPGMMGLRQALEEIQGTVRRLAPVGTAPTNGTPGGAHGDAPVPTNGSVPAQFNIGAGSVQSRDQAYRLIGQIADELARIEPHSPIPDLLRRAVTLGRMPFRQLIKELIHDSGNLSQVYREFGIKDDGTDASG